MRVDFKELPGAGGDYLRPVLPVTVAGLEAAPLLCLLDTGSLQNRLPLWVAELAGIDLSGADPEHLGIGGFQTHARTAVTALTVGAYTWEAPVSFCDPWHPPFGLLGQEGFFRWFDVRFRVAHDELELAPDR